MPGKVSKSDKPKSRVSRKDKAEKHRVMMDAGLAAEIKFNSVMAEERMQEQERKAEKTNKAFAAKKLAEKIAAQGEKIEGDKVSLGEGLLMASGLDVSIDGDGVKDEAKKKEKKDKHGKKRTAKDAEIGDEGTAMNGEDALAESVAKKSKKSKSSSKIAETDYASETAALDGEAESAAKKSKQSRASELDIDPAPFKAPGQGKRKRKEVREGSQALAEQTATVAPPKDSVEGITGHEADKLAADSAKDADKIERQKCKNGKRAEGKEDSAVANGEPAVECATTEKKSKKQKKCRGEKDIAEEPAQVNGIAETTATHRHKKDKKKSKDDVASTAQAAPTVDLEVIPNTKAVSKGKKDKKRKADQSIDTPADESSSAPTTKKSKKCKSSSDTPAQTDGAADSDPADSKRHRFIAFLGNLPFTATVADIEAHLSSLSPFGVRLQHEKGTLKSKGIAFVEFKSHDRLQICLKRFHHSSFDNGKSPARKINVELTTGGGGKSEARQERLKGRNKSLEEERKRDREKRMALREEKGEGGDEDVGMGGMHPSRRARMA